MPPTRIPPSAIAAAPRPCTIPDYDDVTIPDTMDDLPEVLPVQPPEPVLVTDDIILDDPDVNDISNDDPSNPKVEDKVPDVLDKKRPVEDPMPDSRVGDIETSPKFEDEEAIKPLVKELPPFVFEDYESDEDDFLSSLGGVASGLDPRVVHASSLAKGEEEYNFYEVIRAALETYKSEMGKMPSRMPIGTPNFTIELHHMKALARILKDPIMGASVKTFVAEQWINLSGLGLKWILNALHCNRNVETVRIVDTQFDAAGARRLVRFVETSPHIRTLELPKLSSIQTNDIALRALLRVLPTNASITSLNLDDCTYSETTFNMLLAVVSTNTTLEELSLQRSDFSYHNRAQRFMQALVDNTATKLKKIHFPLMRGTIVWIAQMLTHNQSLTHISLSGISLGTHSALLQDALRSNKKLINLNLSTTGINDGHLAVLLEPLYSNNTLQVLSLSSNSQLGPQSAKNIAAMLMENTGLNTLYLDSLTSIPSDILAKKLGPALRVNSSLHELSITNSSTESAGAAALGDALSVNHALHILNLDSNFHFDDSCLSALLKHIKSNYGLHSLILSSCKIGDSSVKTLIPLLKTTNTLISRLDLSSNKISEQSLASLNEAIASNPKLRSLVFGVPTIQPSLRERLVSLRSDVLSFFS